MYFNKFLIAGLGSLGAILGSLISTKLISRYGHNITTMVILPAVVVSWLTMGFATTSGLVLFSRTVYGIFRGVAFVCIPSYLAEILHYKIKGRYSSILVLFLVIGKLAVNTHHVLNCFIKLLNLHEI